MRSSERFAVIDPSGAALALGDVTLTIGSDAACDLQLTGAAARHVSLTGGTVEAHAECALGGIVLRAGERRRLAVATTLRIAGTDLRIEPAVPEGSTRWLALQLVRAAGREPSLLVVEGPAAGRALDLEDGRDYRVGRSSKCELQLDDVGVSREHAVVSRRGAQVLVQDLGSRRGTLLAGAMLEPRRRALWQPGDMLLVGSHVIACRLPTALSLAEGGSDGPRGTAVPVERTVRMSQVVAAGPRPAEASSADASEGGPSPSPGEPPPPSETAAPSAATLVAAPPEVAADRQGARGIRALDALVYGVGIATMLLAAVGFLALFLWR